MRGLISNLESRDLGVFVKETHVPKEGEIGSCIGLGTTIHVGTNLTIGGDLMNSKVPIEVSAGKQLVAK